MEKSKSPHLWWGELQIVIFTTHVPSPVQFIIIRSWRNVSYGDFMRAKKTHLAFLFQPISTLVELFLLNPKDSILWKEKGFSPMENFT